MCIRDRYYSLSKLYVRNAKACVVVCDITNEQSLQSTLKWKSLIEEDCEVIDDKTIPIILLQNKIDLVDEKEKVQAWENLEKFQKEYGFSRAYQVSAKDGTNVSSAMGSLVAEVFAFTKVDLKTLREDGLVDKKKTADSDGAKLSLAEGNLPAKEKQVKKNGKAVEKKSGGCC
eukprot:TRINITY_DN31256_c0_g1_i1.p1 TRINITY_DN31256_c0_g1~~TRINITY_DN31256_c0_g1_i1.p1  ORF type:complete len:173 (-),score=48.01 TRINITY_DN31256_c0_g1_i1:236-754(-)